MKKEISTSFAFIVIILCSLISLSILNSHFNQTEQEASAKTINSVK